MTWTARDWRQFTALTLLALAAIPLTLILAGALVAVYYQPRNVFAFNLGLATAALILVDLVCLGAILGRRTFRFKVGDNEVEATGEDGERVLEGAD
jgi:hypothetical protein